MTLLSNTGLQVLHEIMVIFSLIRFLRNLSRIGKLLILLYLGHLLTFAN